MKNQIKVNTVVLLEQKGEVDFTTQTLWLNSMGQLLHTHTSPRHQSELGLIPQQLYLVLKFDADSPAISNLTKGDFSIVWGQPDQVKDALDGATSIVFEKNSLLFGRYSFPKIIATTNQSLGLPLIDAGFLNDYTADYNDGKFIFDTYIETEYFDRNVIGVSRVKKTESGHCIASRVKSLWDENEIKEIGTQLFTDGHHIAKIATFEEYWHANMKELLNLKK